MSESTNAEQPEIGEGQYDLDEKGRDAVGDGPTEAVDREPTPGQWGPSADFGTDEPEDADAPVAHGDGSQAV